MPSDSKSRSALVRPYGVALASLVVALIFTLVLYPFVGPSIPYLFPFLFLFAIIFSAWQGYGPGLLTCFIALVILPNFSRSPNRASRVDPARGSLVVVISLLISRLSSTQRRTARSLRESNEQLDERVRQRTAELASATQTIRSSEERLHFVLDSAAIGYWDYDIATDRATRSRMHDRIFGHDAPVAEWTFPVFLSHVHRDDVARVEGIFAEARAGAEVSEEFRIVHPDGAVRWLWAHAHAEFEDRRPVRISGIVIDITDRKEALERLRLIAETGRVMASSLDYRRALESVADLLTKDLATFAMIDVLEGPDGPLRRVGWSHHEPSRRTLFDHIQRYPPTLDLPHHPVAIALRSGKTQVMPGIDEEWLRLAAGSPERYGYLRELKPYALVTAPMVAGDRINGAVSVWRDASFRHAFTPDEIALVEELGRRTGIAIENARLYEALSESEQRFRILADAAPVLIWATGKEKHFEFFNRQALEFTGCATEQDLCECWAALLDPRDAEHYHRITTSAFEARTPFNLEYRLRRRDGVFRWLYDNGVPRFSSTGEFLGYIGSSFDITDRKESDEKLRQAGKLESLGVLAGGIAHDFNNLLVGILGNSSLAMEILPEDHPVRPALGNVIKASEKAADLTRQMLAYAGKGQFVVDVFDLSTLVREMSDLLRVSLAKTVAIELDLANDLPPIEADRTQIQQIVMNLVINAAEACEPLGGGRVTVTTGTRTVDEAFIATFAAAEHLAPGLYVALEVQDTGIGMDAETQSKIFDPFFSTKFTGRGLGLSAVLGIVRSNHGGLKVYSSPGKGTTFKILFPAAAGAQKVARRETAAASEPAGSGLILVVDDEPVVRDTARGALERAGYSVVVAEDGQAALERVRERGEEISLVLLDLTMPVMSGEETFRRMQEIRPGMKILVSSGYNEVEAVRQFKSNGIGGFIQKPYTAAALLRKIGAVLRNG